MHRQVPVLGSSTKNLGKGHRKQCTVGQHPSGPTTGFPAITSCFLTQINGGPQNMRIHRSVPTASPALAASLEEAAGVGTGCLPSRVEGSNQHLDRACESPRWFKSTHHCGQIAVALRLKFHLFGGNAYIELISTLMSHM